jgi:hypothetical protein
MVQILYHDEDDYGKPLKEIKEINRKLTSADIVNFAINIDKTIESIKPYLLSMSSMTDEEQNELYCIDGVISVDFEFQPYQMVHLLKSHNVIDWFNKHHFDYRDLINKGLAIEAPAGMYV